MILCTQYSGHDIIIETETGLVVTGDWVWGGGGGCSYKRVTTAGIFVDGTFVLCWLTVGWLTASNLNDTFDFSSS